MPQAQAIWMQLGVLVNDGSGSMTWPYAEGEGPASDRTKGAAVGEAVGGLVGRLQKSRKAKNFSLAIVSFNDSVTDQRPARAVTDMSADDAYDPTLNGIGGTAIHSGLSAAKQIVSEFLEEGMRREIPASAVVVLLSDGEEKDDLAKTKAAAAELKELRNTSLATCLFATAGEPPYGEELLKECASDSRLYKRVCTKDELRDFFEASVTSRQALPPGAE